MKISILLPYKENFAPNYAGAVSLFVNDITNVSFFKKSTYIFGNTNSKKKLVSYVGSTNNLDNRLKLHNTSKGAKFTKGRKWTLIYNKKYNSRSKALSEEYKLKKDYKLRSKLKLDYIKKNENFYTASI